MIIVKSGCENGGGKMRDISPRDLFFNIYNSIIYFYKEIIIYNVNNNIFFVI